MNRKIFCQFKNGLGKRKNIENTRKAGPLYRRIVGRKGAGQALKRMKNKA